MNLKNWISINNKLKAIKMKLQMMMKNLQTKKDQFKFSRKITKIFKTKFEAIYEHPH
jgi:hypothetical protein